MSKLITQKLLNNLLYVFFFLVIVFFAASIRTKSLYERVSWYNDSARDAFVAKEISTNKHFFKVAPQAALGNGILQNSYIYYNFLSILWSVGNSLNSLMVLYISFGLLSLIAGWKVGEIIGGKWLGLSSLFILSTNWSLANYQISLYQRNFLPSLSLFIILFLVNAVKKKTLTSLFLLLLFFTFSSLIHLSILTFLPAIIFTFLFTLKDCHISRLKKGFIIIFSLVIFPSLFLLLTRQELAGNVTSFSKVLPLSADASEQSNIEYLFERSIISLKSLNISTFRLNSSLPLIMLITLIFYFVIKVDKKNKHFPFMLTFLSLTLTYILLHFLFLFTQNYTFISNSYLQHYDSLFLILSPLVLFSYLKTYLKKLVSLGMIILCSGFFLMNFESIDSLLKNRLSFSREFQRSEILAEAIVKDYTDSTKDLSLSSLVVVDYSEWAGPGWFSPSVIFFINERYNHPKTKIISDFNNLEFEYSLPTNTIYVLCNSSSLENWDKNISSFDIICLNKFKDKWLKDYSNLDDDETKSSIIKIEESEETTIAVYKISKK